MKKPQAGISLVELTVAILLISVAVTALMAGFTSVARLDDETRNNTVLTVASRNLIESLKVGPFQTVTTDFGAGSGREKFWFGSDGELLFIDPGDAVTAGKVSFFNDESAIPAEFPGLANGFDLNGNGVIDVGPITDYTVLPTRLTLSTTDGRSLTFDFIFSELTD